MGFEGQNCNGEKYTPTARTLLHTTITSPGGYLYGTIHLREKKPAPTIRQWLSEGVHRPRAEQWVDKDVLSSANVNGRLGPFIKALRSRTLVLVGPRHLLDLKLFDVRCHMYVGNSTAMFEAQTVVRDLKRVVLAYNHPVVLFSAGMATNVMVWLMDRWLPAEVPVSMIDCGALWDPYVGVLSRKHYRRHEWQMAKAANLMDD